MRRILPLICLFVAGAAQASHPLDQARTFDRLWATYVPTLHSRFMERLTLDDATLEALHTSGSDGESTAQRVRLLLHLDQRGRVTNVTVRESADASEFTHACTQAARQLGRLPSLPPAILRRGQREGLEFVFGTTQQ